MGSGVFTGTDARALRDGTLGGNILFRFAGGVAFNSLWGRNLSMGERGNEAFRYHYRRASVRVSDINTVVHIVNICGYVNVKDIV